MVAIRFDIVRIVREGEFESVACTNSSQPKNRFLSAQSPGQKAHCSRGTSDAHEYDLSA